MSLQLFMARIKWELRINDKEKRNGGTSDVIALQDRSKIPSRRQRSINLLPAKIIPSSPATGMRDDTKRRN